MRGREGSGSDDIEGGVKFKQIGQTMLQPPSLRDWWGTRTLTDSLNKYDKRGAEYIIFNILLPVAT